MEKQLDLRVQKTHKALTSALYELLCEKSMNDITVTELCERAVIRKATFYKHFGDKTDLLVFMIQELQRLSVEENAIGYDPDVPQSYYIGVFRYFIDFLDSNEQFISSVLRSNASSVLQEILSEQIMFDMRLHLKDEKLETLKDANDMFAALYTGAIVSCGKWWITQKDRADKEAVIRKFAEFIIKL
jgi:AcrR family transcriptional regulator